MRQQPFEQVQRPAWERYRALLDALDGRSEAGRRDPGLPLHELPGLFRTLCGHYALARSRGYSPGLTAELHDLVQRGYRHLYRRRRPWARRVLTFMARDFPATLRRQAWAFWLAAGLLFLPMLAMGLACYQDSELIYGLLDRADVANLESMYDPGRGSPPGDTPPAGDAPTSRELGRDAAHHADGRFAMFGFYVMNNVGIGFRSFASGLFLGLGSAFILVFNGLVIGAAAGHLTRLGFGGTFWPFVVGHGALELTAIALCGAAGLLLGQALLAPGRQTRLAALRTRARGAVVLVLGAMAMLVLAALIEAFWSPLEAVPIWAKVVFGVLWWVLVALYFAFAGRGTSDGP